MELTQMDTKTKREAMHFQNIYYAFQVLVTQGMGVLEILSVLWLFPDLLTYRPSERISCKLRVVRQDIMALRKGGRCIEALTSFKMYSSENSISATHFYGYKFTYTNVEICVCARRTFCLHILGVNLSQPIPINSQFCLHSQNNGTCNIMVKLNVTLK